MTEASQDGRAAPQEFEKVLHGGDDGGRFLR